MAGGDFSKLPRVSICLYAVGRPPPFPHLVSSCLSQASGFLKLLNFEMKRKIMVQVLYQIHFIQCVT